MAFRVYGRAAVCLGLLAGAAVLASEDLGGRVAAWRLASALASVPDLATARVTRDADGGRLVLEDVGLARGGWRVSIGRLTLPDRLPGFTLVGPAAAETATLLADDIRIVGERHVYSVPHLEIRGTPLTSSDLADLLDTTRPEPLAGRLAKFTAAVVRAPTILMEVDGAGAGGAYATVTVHDIALTDVAGGRIGSVTAQRADLVERDKPDVTPLQIGRIRVDVLDLPLVLKLAGNDRGDAKAPLGLLLAGLSVESLAMHHAGDGDLTVGAFRSGAVRARPLPDTLDRTVSLVDRPYDQLTTPERQALIEGVADVLGSYDLDHVEVGDLAFKNTSYERITLTLGRLALNGLGLRSPLSLALDAMTLDGPELALSLDHFTAWGIDQAGAFSLARSGISPPAAGRIEINLKANPVRTAAALDALTITVPASGGTGNAPDGTHNVIQIPEMSVSAGSMPVGNAVTTAASLRVLYAMPRAIADPTLKAVADLGIKRFEVSTGYAVAFDAGAKSLTIENAAVHAANLGSVALTAVLGNVDPGSTQAATSSVERTRAAGAISLDSLSVRIVNEGLVALTLPSLAASAKVSVPVFKASLKAQAEVAIAQALGGTDTAMRLTQAVSTFIDDPRNLTITVKMPPDMTLDTVKAVGEPASLLANGMTIEAVADR